MPKAPLYNGPQVTPGQFSGGMLSTHVADMSPIGAGLTSLGENLFRIRREEQQRAQDMQLTQALGKAREAQTTELYDPQDGLMLKEGGDLFSSVADRLDRFKQKLSSIRDSLSSDDARLTFDRASDSLFQEVNRSAQIRVGTQREKTNEQTARGFIDSDVDAVANGLTYTAPATVPSNPDGSFNFQAIDDTLYRMTLSVRDKVVNKAGGHAVPDEQVIKEESIKEQGQAALKWLDIMLANGDTKMADAFMKRYGHIIPTDKKGTAIRAVESGTVASEAQGHADGIIDYVSTGTKLTLTQQEAKANEQIAARFKDDVKMRDEVQRRVTVEFNRRQALEKGAVEDTFKDYYERLNKGEKLGKMEVELAFHTMDPRHQDLIRKMSEEKEAGKDLGKDEAKIYKYMQVAYSNDPKVREQFRTMDLTTIPGITPKEFVELRKVQIDLQQANISEQGKTEYDSIRNVHEISEDAARVAGFTDKSKEKYEFQKKLEEQVAAVQQRTGKKLVPGEVQKMADELLLKKAEGMLSRDKYLFQLTPEEIADPAGKIAWDKIPDTDKNRIRSQWQKSKGKTPEKEEIQRQYFNEVRLRQQSRGISFQK
jgi:hypothetical protein